MLIRVAQSRDIDVVMNWFADKQWPYPPVDDGFPGIGLVSELSNGDLVTCMFLYRTPTSIAQLSWFGHNPDIKSEKLVKDAYNFMISYFQKIQMTLQPPVRFVEVITKDKALVDILAECGFYIKNNFIRATYMAPRSENANTTNGADGEK